MPGTGGDSLIPLDQNFSQIVLQAHALLDTHGENATVCFDGVSLFVRDNAEHSAGNAEHSARNVDIASQSPLIRSTHSIPVQSLAHAIDREYGDLMAGDYKLSEYALMHLQRPNNRFELTKEALVELENRVLIGVNLAYNTAVRNEDKLTMVRLDIAEGENQGRNAGASAPKEANNQIRMSERSEGHRLLRDAIVSELENTTLFAELKKQGVLSDAERHGNMLVAADQIMTDTGAMRSGLTEESLNDVLGFMEKNFTYDIEPDAINISRFPAFDALYDKLMLSNSVSANLDRLQEVRTDLENSLHEEERSGSLNKTDADELSSLLNDGKAALEQLGACVKTGALYDSAVAEIVSKDLKRIALAAEALRKGQPDENQDADINRDRQHSGAGNQFAERLEEFVVTAYDLARSLAPRRDEKDASFDTVTTIARADDPLQQEDDIFANDRPLAQRLEPSTSVYKKDSQDQSGPVSQAQKDVKDYNAQLTHLRQSHEDYVAAPNAGNLNAFQEDVDHAIDLSNRIALHQRSAGPERLGAQSAEAGDNRAILNDQSRDLRRLSFSVDRTMQQLSSNASGAPNRDHLQPEKFVWNDDVSGPDSNADKSYGWPPGANEIEETMQEVAIKKIFYTGDIPPEEFMSEDNTKLFLLSNQYGSDLLGAITGIQRGLSDFDEDLEDIENYAKEKRGMTATSPQLADLKRQQAKNDALLQSMSKFRDDCALKMRNVNYDHFTATRLWNRLVGFHDEVMELGRQHARLAKDIVGR